MLCMEGGIIHSCGPMRRTFRVVVDTRQGMVLLEDLGDVVKDDFPRFECCS